MSLAARRAELEERRARYQEALDDLVLQPDMLVDKKRTFRTEWFQALNAALKDIDEQLAKLRPPYSIRVGVESA